jgi:DNA polymerase IV
LPPQTSDPKIIKMYFLHMVEKVAARLRQNNLYASKFFVGMFSEDWGWLAIKHQTFSTTQHGDDIYKGCEEIFKKYPRPGAIRQIQVTALNPLALKQLTLFDDEKIKRQSLLDNAIDKINNKFGNYTIMPAPLLHKSKTPNVISPAWKPSGVRKTV